MRLTFDFGTAAATRNNPPIRIMDAIMGTGKSTGVIKELNLKVEHGTQHDEPTLIVLPYLSEIDRFKEQCPGMDFKVPSTDSGCRTKSDALKLLLLNGDNILCTHALFKLWDDETARFIEQGYYHVIIDEVVDCLKALPITATTIKELKELELIDVDPKTKRVHWDFEKSDDANGEYHGAKEHQAVRRHCSNGSIYMYGNEESSKPFIVWEIPYRFFQIARSYTILTYRFNSSELAAFLRTHDIAYNIENPDPSRQAELKARAKELIQLIDPLPNVKKLTNGRNTLSISWYERCTKADMKSIRDSISNQLRRKLKAAPENTIWTCPKEYGTAAGKQGKKHMAIRCYKDRHIAWTTKGTNDYRHCDTVVYLHNVFPNVNVQKYLNDKGADWSDDGYALSCLLQFIWRSCIRDGKPVKVMIVNRRMRELLEEWLDT